MDVRVGATVDGRAAGFDTSSTRPLLLVGDAGRGKTTIARYLTRWWLANTARHAHVYALATSEWADLRCEGQHPDVLKLPLGRDCRAGVCLVVVDDVDRTSEEQIVLLPFGEVATIVTSYGARNSLASGLLSATGVICLGLIRPALEDPADAAVLEGQGRLDWPMGTVAVVADQRGPIDFPCHRWHTRAGDWAVAR